MITNGIKANLVLASFGILALILAGCVDSRSELIVDAVELQPLPVPGSNAMYTGTYPNDINDLGIVVGKSFCDTAFGAAPCPSDDFASTATLWKNGVPQALSTSANPSHALKINDRGEVLYVQYDNKQATQGTYFL
ncbi:MAG: hypothetical protein U1E42_05160 [Rhodospirillales bacterium]